jgi:hypothetical protein
MKKLLAILTTVAASIAPQVSQAAPLYVYSPPGSFDIMANPACIAEGDFVSCSTSFLNYLNNIGSPNYNTTVPSGYVIDSNQGNLKDMVVVGTGAGGQIPTNTDFSDQIDKGYDIPNNGNFETSTAADPAMGPTVGDSAVAWDTTIQALLDALTIDGIRKNMMIGYDFNETGGTGQATMIWSMVTLRDVDGNLAPISFELNGAQFAPAASVYSFNTQKTPFDGTTPTQMDLFGGDPTKIGLQDFTYIAGDICVKPDGTFLPLFAPQTTCPDGYTHISNNLGTNAAEWISYIPELDEGLEAFMAQGYDVLSAEVKIGCFAPTGVFGSTFCNDGGYDDIFIMAGDIRNNVPEPSALLLFGAALLGLGMVRRRIS